jgi:U3 small nucleolar RNA-associated protein 12
LKLFLEEEREKELERLYESEIADTLNQQEMTIGSGVADGALSTGAETEVSAVQKQTTETLMAGERIMEALDLADRETEAFHDYEEAMAKLPEDDAMRMQPPPRNPILAAYDVEPDIYVLQVVEKIPSSSLHDALLVLPFGKVVSLMGYLNLWAQKVVRLTFLDRMI